MADARLEVTDALRTAHRPHLEEPFEIGRRETNDLRLAGSEVSRDHAEIAIDGNQFTARPEFPLRHLRQRRAGHRARARARRQGSGSAAAAAPRWCSCSPTRSRRSTGRRPRRSATCARSRRCSKACARSAPAACSTTCSRWCWIRRSRSAAPSAASSCWRETDGARVQDGARPRPQHAVRRQLRHQPQDPRGGLPDRRAAASSPTCSTAISPTSTWAPSRSASATCSACRCGSCATSTRRERRRGAAHRRALSRQPREGDRCCPGRRARRSRRWRPKPPSRSRTRGSIARRWRRRGWSRRCGSPPRSSRPCCRRPARAGAYFRAAAASLPCRSIGGDFYDYVDLADGSLGFALGDVAGKGRPRRC